MRTALILIATITYAACGNPVSPPMEIEHSITYAGRGSTFHVNLPTDAGTVDAPPLIELWMRCSIDTAWTRVDYHWPQVRVDPTWPDVPQLSPLTVTGAYFLECPYAAANWRLVVTYSQRKGNDQ